MNIDESWKLNKHGWYTAKKRTNMKLQNGWYPGSDRSSCVPFPYTLSSRENADALANPSAHPGAPAGTLTLTIVDCAASVKGVARFSRAALLINRRLQLFRRGLVTAGRCLALPGLDVVGMRVSPDRHPLCSLLFLRGGDDEYTENGDVPGWVEPTTSETKASNRNPAMQSAAEKKPQGHHSLTVSHFKIGIGGTSSCRRGRVGEEAVMVVRGGVQGCVSVECGVPKLVMDRGVWLNAQMVLQSIWRDRGLCDSRERMGQTMYRRPLQVERGLGVHYLEWSWVERASQPMTRRAGYGPSGASGQAHAPDPPTFLASVPPPTPTPSPIQLPPPPPSPVHLHVVISKSDHDVMIRLKTCVSLPKESASRKWSGNLKGTNPCSGQRRDATKLAPAQVLSSERTTPPSPGYVEKLGNIHRRQMLEGVVWRILMCSKCTTGQKKWMRMRVYACVRRMTGNLAAFSELFLFRLFFPEKMCAIRLLRDFSNSIGEER
ncbi:hypothetical protein BGW80DRAFT_1253083 [Lactifluus volemus]|nr:hypothetical protein BGW80DRAFT_1253083 [Lactifluus volemus]